MVYQNGLDICIGDIVSLHFKEYKGTIVHIIESEHDIQNWGLDKPGVMIDTNFSGITFYEKTKLTADEVSLRSRSTIQP